MITNRLFTGSVLLFLAGLHAQAQAATPLDTLPSSLPLQDYETRVLYPWLHRRGYADAETGFTVDSRVRDTGAFIALKYYGTHPAVRVYYSPPVRAWIEGGRVGSVPDGGIIVKEMFKPPAAVYNDAMRHAYFRSHPDEYRRMLADLVVGWAVMIKDSGGNSKDGWFWSSPGNKPTLAEMLAPESGNVDDYSHVLTSAFGIGTCIRCHASAQSENTFSSRSNYDPALSPVQYRVDNSWRSKAYLGSVFDTIEKYLEKDPDRSALLVKLDLPAQQRPWRDSNAKAIAEYVSEHDPAEDDSAPIAGRQTDYRNADFMASFASMTRPADQRFGPEQVRRFSFPSAWSDHVIPQPAIERGGTDNPSQYLTSDNCYGCHGGLGGAPYALTMFVQTGPDPGEGYNISEYGEWRWSPMGLAGRDPIFHAQLESELILLLRENGQLRKGRPAIGEVATIQQALVDTCLRCHGAMGLRQKGIDQGGDILNPDFDVHFFYLEDPLTREAEKDPGYEPLPNEPNPPSGLGRGAFYASHDLGELAREGISCTVCHHITAPDPKTAADWVSSSRADHPDWIGPSGGLVWSDSFFYFLANDTTGLYTRSPADGLAGPYDDVKEKPMQNALGITPAIAPVMHHGTPFISDSAMCGTCHTINLPNIGQKTDENPVLTALEPNVHFQGIPHSIEQATYLEWLNSDFGLGKDNKKGPHFKSCQDCHMPNRFETLDGSVRIPKLATQIATIQGASYGESEHQLPLNDLEIETRSDYARHELVGLNAFMVEMVRQFPAVLGVEGGDYETGATTGAQLAIDNMLLSAKEGRVATVAIESARVVDGALNVDVSVTNTTGHRFPSGVAFRRGFLELLVLDAQGKVLWGSGRTNDAGLIVDGDGNPLPTELLDQKARPTDAIAQYQPNYQTITSESQAQIYEELVTDASNAFTTSFIHRVRHVKDNRLLPRGWVDAETFAGKSPDAGIGDQGDLLLELMRATEPEGASVVGGTDANGKTFPPDSDFSQTPSTGADHLRYGIPLKDLRGQPATVQATLYSQSFSPAWFRERFALANAARRAGYSTPETDRLFYLASRLQLDKTPLEGWKVAIQTAKEKVRQY